MEHEGDNYTNWDCAFGIITKWLLNRKEDLVICRQVETILKLQPYWEWPEYWEESWRLEENCCLSKSTERPSAKTDVKNSKSVNNNNNNKRRRRRRRRRRHIDRYYFRNHYV